MPGIGEWTVTQAPVKSSHLEKKIPIKNEGVSRRVLVCVRVGDGWLVLCKWKGGWEIWDSFSHTLAAKTCSDGVVPENIHTPPPPPEGTFALDPHCPRTSIPVGACHTPNFHHFSTWLGTLWKEYLCQKCCCTLLFCELIFFCDKMRKNLFIHVNTVSNNLKDVLS